MLADPCKTQDAFIHIFGIQLDVSFMRHLSVLPLGISSSVRLAQNVCLVISGF